MEQPMSYTNNDTNLMNSKLKSLFSIYNVVFLDGKWGIGKTFLWNKYVEESDSPEKFVKISLLGVESKECFRNEFVRQRAESIEGEVRGLVKAILKDSALSGQGFIKKFFGADVRNSLGVVSKYFEEQAYKKCLSNITVCLDDLERSDISITNLGAIIEEIIGGNSKVLVIGNAEKLKSQYVFREYAEKLFGVFYTYEDNAFAIKSSLKAIKNKHMYPDNYVDIVLSIVKQTGCNNIRVLTIGLKNYEYIVQEIMNFSDVVKLEVFKECIHWSIQEKTGMIIENNTDRMYEYKFIPTVKNFIKTGNIDFVLFRKLLEELENKNTIDALTEAYITTISSLYTLDIEKIVKSIKEFLENALQKAKQGIYINNALIRNVYDKVKKLEVEDITIDRLYSNIKLTYEKHYTEIYSEYTKEEFQSKYGYIKESKDCWEYNIIKNLVEMPKLYNENIICITAYLDDTAMNRPSIGSMENSIDCIFNGEAYINDFINSYKQQDDSFKLKYVRFLESLDSALYECVSIKKRISLISAFVKEFEVSPIFFKTTISHLEEKKI